MGGHESGRLEGSSPSLAKSAKDKLVERLSETFGSPEAFEKEAAQYEARSPAKTDGTE